MPPTQRPVSRVTAQWEKYPCAAVGCAARVSRLRAQHMFCDTCWRTIAVDVQRLVERAYRAEFTDVGRWSARFERAMKWAVEEAWNVKTEGHRIPTGTRFDF